MSQTQKKLDLSKIDKLNELLAGSLTEEVRKHKVGETFKKGPITVTMAAGDGEKPVQKENLIVIEDTPLYEVKPADRSNFLSEAKKEQDQLRLKKVEPKESDVGLSYRKNADIPLGVASDVATQKGEFAAEKEKESQADKDYLSKLTEELKGGIGKFSVPKTEKSFDAESFYSRLNSQLESLEKPEAKMSFMEGMLKYGLPTLLSYAGGVPQAGLKYLDTAQKMEKEEADRVKDEKKSRIESIGKQLQGAGELRKADTEAQKAAFEESKYSQDSDYKKYQLIADISKNMFDKGMISKDKMEQIEFDAQKEYLNKYMSASGKYADIEKGALDRESQEKRAEVLAGASKVRQDLQQKKDLRPSNEERKNFKYYSDYKRADEAMNKLQERYGGAYPLMKYQSGPLITRAMSAQGGSDSDPLNFAAFKTFLVKNNTNPDVLYQLNLMYEMANAKARGETGAAITNGEWQRYLERVAPIGANVNQDMLKNFKQVRINDLNGLKFLSGRAFGYTDENQMEPQKQSQQLQQQKPQAQNSNDLAIKALMQSSAKAGKSITPEQAKKVIEMRLKKAGQ